MRRQRSEGSGPRSMPMEGRIPMAPRKDLGSQQRRNSDQPYTTTPRYSASGTRRNGKNNVAPPTQILLASQAQNDKTIRQELRHVPRTKVVRHASYGLMKPNESSDRPWKSISMDFITDLPKSEGDDAILIVID